MEERTSRRLKIIAGADSFGCALKDALVDHLRSLDIDVEDIGTDKYYSVGEQIGRRVSSADSHSGIETRGLVACGTGVGVSIFANKFPGVYAATCLNTGEARNTRSINNCNVLAVSGTQTSPESAIEILETWLSTPFRSPCPASDSKPWPKEIDSFLENSISEMSKIGSDAAKPSDSKPWHKETDSFLDNSASEMSKIESDAATPSDAKPSSQETGSFFEISVSEISTIGSESGIPSIDSLLRNSASAISKNGSEAAKPSVDSFVENSVSEMSQAANSFDSCAICSLARAREFTPVEIMPGAEMKIVRESPTSAIVRFKAESVEPAHHHTFGHDVVVLKGSKRVWNLTKGEKYDLGVSDYLYTPAGDVHRVKYLEDSEFFIRWDGQWDIFLDEDVDAAKAAVKKETN